MARSAQLKEDLKRLARLAANISEAYTSAILLPTGLLSGESNGFVGISPVSRGFGSLGESPAPPIELKKVVDAGTAVSGVPLPSPAVSSGSLHRLGSIELVASQTLSQAVPRECRVQVGHGLLGWVAEQGRSIHIAPFDLDSISLGVYSDSEPIKSLLALPVPIPTDGAQDGRRLFGVLMCDSRKAYSFTKVQIKHLEDLALEISRLLYWALGKSPAAQADVNSWDEFAVRVDRLADAIGHTSVDILRIAVRNFESIEEVAGTSAAVRRSEQFARLVQQALPPHFPLVRLPNGELLVALDNMMTSFFQNKIRMLADHLAEPKQPFEIVVTNFSARAVRGRSIDLDAILGQRSSGGKNSTGVGGGRA